jgi:predicted TIM-barrel fold metal-dependent hydrolase
VSVALDAATVRGQTTPWIFDTDGHVVEPPGSLEELLPARLRDYAPRIVQEDGAFRFRCGDTSSFSVQGSATSLGAPGQTPWLEDAPVAARGASDPGPRLDDMAVDRIAAVALYPTMGLMIQGVTEREPALALCRAVNDWLAAYCERDPVRLVGVATLPMTDAGDALAEARRCVERHGFRGVWRRPEHFGALPRLQDEEYEPLWSYLEDAGVPFGIHPGMNGLVPYDEIGARYDDYLAPLHATHFVTQQIMCLTTFVAYGILERHPRLRVSFLETGAVWAMPYLHRLDEHFEVFGFERASLTMRPSDYFRRQCFVSVEGVEPALPLMLEQYPGSIVFSSDYPHADGVFPGSTTELLETDALDDAAACRVLRDNGRRLYGLDGDSSPASPEPRARVG